MGHLSTHLGRLGHGIDVFPPRHLRQRPRPIARFYCDALGFEKAESHAIGGTPLAFVYCTDPGGVRIDLMDLGG